MSNPAHLHRWLRRSATLAARLMKTCVKTKYYSTGK